MHKFRMSGLRKLALVLETLLIFLALDVILSRWPFEKTYRSIMPRLRPPSPPASDSFSEEIVAQITGAVATATRYYYRRKEDCLPRSFALCRLLRREGLPAELCLGVRQFPFSAHAWVECQGQLIDDSPQRISRYRLLARLKAFTSP